MTIDANAPAAHALETGTEERASLLTFVDANLERPRMLLTLSRLLQQRVAAHPDDLEVTERYVEVTRRLTALDARHAKWFGEVPNHLLMKVNGSPERNPFLNVGKSVTSLLQQELSVLPEAEAILDFGVGLSRVLWPMMQEYPEAAFTGFDVDPMMLVESQRLGSIADARLVHSTQPIRNGSIDATYVISVFTHLMETADFWFAEIHRMLSDRGQAFLTYHDDTLYDDLREKNLIPRNTPERCEGRMLVGTGAEGSTHLAVFYDTAYWEECLERYFVVEKTAPRGLHGHQSFSVVRRRDADVDYDGLRYRYMCTLEEELYQLRLAKKLMF
jgi:Methyltransferase domain